MEHIEPVPCMNHSGVIEQLRGHSGRIEKVTEALDTHLAEHRRNSTMIYISTVTSSIAALASLGAAALKLLD